MTTLFKACKAIFQLAVLMTIPVYSVAQTYQSNPYGIIVGEIKKLEGDKDPKCYATANRLEDFMYGTPLAAQARVEKIALQKQFIRTVWKSASDNATAKQQKKVNASVLRETLAALVSYNKQPDGDWLIKSPKTSIEINADDKRQYGSIAYALRAILAVQQEMIMDAGNAYLPLKADAIEVLKEVVDLYTLAAMKQADSRARSTDAFLISADMLSDAWRELGLTNAKVANAPKVEIATPAYQQSSPALPRFSIIKQIIKQKVASYATYNHISTQIFARNLQVYFSRHRWPSDPKLGQEIKRLFTTAMVYFTNDLYVGAEQVALKKGHKLVRVDDVHDFAQSFIPHSVNEYEDVTFFPKLPAADRITIESYDMDAFRDSGVHWRYLQSAIEAPNFKGRLEPDPFAAELIVENVAQFGVLALRVIGEVGKASGAERMHPEFIDSGLKLIQAKIHAHSKALLEPEVVETIQSSPDSKSANASGTYFTNETQSSGIDYMHRSSDWLNRLIRTYALKSRGVGQLTIPPAFGGSGVAAEDINQDGWPDLLILGGRGNRLYFNDRKGGFLDVTRQAKLDWVRKDGRPGEPRQPIIADLDNDGLQDILITYVNDAHRVYKNKGNGQFEDVTDIANLGGEGSVGGPATVFDFDNDGLLDLYITYFGDYLHGILPTLKRRNSNGLANKLFRNKGNMKFEDVTEGSGVNNTGWAQALSHTDLDNDGWQDLIVGNDFGVNAYYRNLGNGRFENIAGRLGTDKPSYTMNVGITDLNDDTFPDIYISNIVTMNKDEKYVTPNQNTPMKFNPNKLANMRVVEANDLFLSKSAKGELAGYQLSNLVGRGYSSTGWSWDADFFDFDNDGDEDLYVLNGMNEFNLYSSENPYYTDASNQKRNVYIPVSSKESNVFFVNEGGKLQNRSKQSGVDLLGNSRSAAYLDYDNDGDLDMVLNNYHEAAVVYRNNSEKLNRNWIKIKLIGDPKRRTNRDAIGARIIATTPNGNKIWREVHGSIGYLSVHPKTQHLGLGGQTKTDLKVIWPNGNISLYNGVTANQRVIIDQRNGIQTDKNISSTNLTQMN